MRTFHIGGAAQVNETVAPRSDLRRYGGLSRHPDHHRQARPALSLARNGEIVVIDSEGRERAIHKVPYGTVLLHEDGAKVKPKATAWPSGIRSPADHHRKAGYGEVPGPDRRPHA
jgi:DNA-directed RNA polymerase subunit beta'